MSNIPWTSLKAKYAEIADLFITEINATNVTLYYKPQVPTVNSNEPTLSPFMMDEFGGRQPIQTLDNRINETQSSGAYLSPSSETIQGRAYWQDQKTGKTIVDKNIAVEHVYLKLITYTTNTDKLNAADYIVVNDAKLRNLEPAFPYGFDKRYSISYWEKI